MELNDGKQRFIEVWGKLGTQWGINRTMAQVHALLLISPRPLCANEIMKELLISRGNANQNLRGLMGWGLVQKELKCGDRKEYFYAEKDMWKMMRLIIEHRKKKELDPMIKALDDLTSVESSCPESDEYCRMMRELKHFSRKADAALETIIKMETNGFIGKVFNMIH